MVFRTCEDSGRDSTLEEIRRFPNVTFFSLLDSFGGEALHNRNNMKLHRSQSDIIPQIADRILGNQEILDSLVRSSRSFTVGLQEKNFKCDSCIKCVCTDCSCEVIDELYLDSLKVDRYTQTMKRGIIDVKHFYNSISSYIAKKIYKIKIFFKK